MNRPTRRPRRSPKVSACPRIEPLESRQLLTTYVVTSDASTGPGTLAAAISLSNADTAGPNTIDFDIPGGGPRTINLNSGIPAITQPINIDATTQPGYITNDEEAADDEVPTIILEETGPGRVGSALDFAPSSARSSAEGLEIVGFAQNGIEIGANNVTITATFVGIGSDGLESLALGNGNDGIVISHANGCLVGGPALASRNLISNNIGTGITVFGSSSDQLSNNYLGVDRSGATTTPGTNPGNRQDDILVLDSTGIVIGGSGGGEGNVIDNASLYGEDGLLIEDSRNCVVQSNLVGIAELTQVAQPDQTGILLQDAPGTTIGGYQDATGHPVGINAIQGNIGTGLSIEATSSTTLLSSFSSLNGIGIAIDASTVSVNGFAALANSSMGYQVKNSPNCTIASSEISGITTGQDPFNSGFISRSGNGIVASNSTGLLLTNDTIDNNGVGVRLDSGADHATITGSIIADYQSYGLYADDSSGLSLNASTVTGNAGIGVRLLDGSNRASITSSTIGGPVANLSNGGGNGAVGLSVEGSSGATIGGVSVESNVGYGVVLSSSPNSSFSNDTITGTTASGLNPGDGLRIVASPSSSLTNVIASGNAGIGINISGSTGVSISGSTVRSNPGGGIDLNSSGSASLATSTIGGDVASEGNGVSGVLILSSPFSSLQNDTIEQNAGIGLAIAFGSNFVRVGNDAIEANAGYGLTDEASTGLRIGGGQVGGNQGGGVRLDRADGSLINTTSLGTSVGNCGDGLDIFESNQVTIGATSTALAGQILGNLGTGLVIEASTDTTVMGLTVGSSGGIGIDAINDEGLRLLGDTVAHSGRDGVALVGDLGASLAEDLDLHSNGGFGLTVAGSDGLTLIGEAAVDNQAGGVSVSRSNNATIGGTTMLRNGGVGLLISDSNFAAIGSRMLPILSAFNQGEGVRLIESGGDFLTDVTTGNNEGIGLAMITSGDNQLVDITSGQNQGAGIAVIDSRSTMISGATIQDNAGAGVSVSPGSIDFYLSGAMIGGPSSLFSNAGPGVTISGSTGALISATIENNRGDGIDLNSSGNASIDGDLILANQGTGVAASASPELSLSRSRIEYQGAFGVAITNASDDAKLEGDTLSGNVGPNLVVTDSKNLVSKE